MIRNLLDLSGKIDSIKLEAIEIISNIVDFLNIPFFVIGATARDFILETGNEIQASRVTLDIDFGVRVPNWNQYMKLKKGLVKTGKFTETGEVQRLIYQKKLRIDLIPFGPITDRKSNIKWPPNDDIVMNILGFEEAFYNSLTVRLRSNPLLEIKVVSLAGLAVMKIISWKDKYPERDKDASDIALIMQSYTDAGNIERIFGEALDLVNSDDFDYVTAGARLLGRDMSGIMTPRSKKVVLKILNEETREQDHYRLIVDIIRNYTVQGRDFKYILNLLEEMKRGILDIS